MKVERSRLRRGRKTLMAKVRSITRHQARLADKNAEGLTSRAVPACSSATNLSKGGLQMALCRKLKEWEGYVIGPLVLLAVFYEAGRNLSYSSCLTAWITGLVVRLVPFHTSATVGCCWSQQIHKNSLLRLV